MIIITDRKNGINLSEERQRERERAREERQRARERGRERERERQNVKERGRESEKERQREREIERGAPLAAFKSKLLPKTAAKFLSHKRNCSRLNISFSPSHLVLDSHLDFSPELNSFTSCSK